MTELDVSNKWIREQQYQNRSESKALRLFLRLKIACHNAYILKIYHRQLFENAMCWYICQEHFMFLYWNQNKFCKPEQWEDNSYNIPISRISLAIRWRSGSFQLKSVGNKKVKIPWEYESINAVMVTAIPWEVLMSLTKYAELNYPYHFLKSRGSVISTNFLFSTELIKPHILRDEMILIYCWL